jgi:hypothetical protein
MFGPLDRAWTWKLDRAIRSALERSTDSAGNLVRQLPQGDRRCGMTNITPEVRVAVQLLGVFTRDRFQVDMLAGPANARNRVAVMSAMAGQRMPQSKSGITAIRAAMYAALNIEGSCQAVRDDHFIAAARAMEGGASC